MAIRKRLQETILFLAPLAALFALCFTSLRVYEFLLLSHTERAQRLEALGFLYDWPFAFFLITIVTICGVFIALISEKAAHISAIIFYSILLLISFSLIQYFSVTQVPLSADLFGYSLNDIRTTVRSSGGFSWITALALFFYIAVFIGGSLWVARKNVYEKISLRIALSCFVIMLAIACLPLKPTHEQFQEETHYHLVVNKSEYFLGRTVSYLSERYKQGSAFGNDVYPFLHKVSYPDVLGTYLNTPEELPHFVFLLVEGLGRDFTGPGGLYSGFTPFLDSLAGHSLYWRNGLSNAGRTFGVLPSVLGSLPYGKDGFMGYGTEMPDHQTLISLLKAKGYTANFFYGGNPNFDNLDIFLQYQGVDFMLNESNFPAAYKKSAANDEGFTWGYADREVFNYSHEILNERNSSPRIDVYLTLSTHEPFICPEKKFEEIFEQRLVQSGWDESRKKVLTEYKNIFSCLLYTDDAIREFINKYKHKPEFAKTIFIITGDHRLIPIPQATRISRFHVPVMIYSPLLKRTQTFESLATHSDIMPSILGYLNSQFEMTFPSSMSFISKGMTAIPDLSSNLDLAFMRNKGEVDDYIFGEYFLSDGRLFKISSNFDLEPVTNGSIFNSLTSKLKAFKSKSIFACENNRLDSINMKGRLKFFTFSDTADEYIEKENLAAMTPDDMFRKGQELAFEKKYDQSRIVLRYLLNKAPNYHDARILLGRTFAWNNQYDTAQAFFQEVLSRSPSYSDAFNASADIEFWKGHQEKSSQIIEEGLAANPDNVDLLARRARALWLAGKPEQARKIAEDVLKKVPQHEIALDILQKSKP